MDDEDLRNASRDVRVWLARRSTFERVFDAARTRMQDGAAFDPRDLFERLDDVKSPAQLSAFFAHAFRPEPRRAQFGRVVKVPGQ